MQKLTEIISKNVYSLATGRKIGYVLAVVLDERLAAVKGITVVDESSENEAFVEMSQISFIADEVLISSEEALSYEGEAYSQIIGKKIFLRGGQSCGTVKQVLLCGLNVHAIMGEQICFSPAQISFVGEDAIFLGKRKNKNNLQKNAIKMQKNANIFEKNEKNDQIISIMPLEISRENAHENSLATPHRISSDPKNLIGKMATRDIFGLNNELIIKKFEIITSKKLNEARKHNKINILFYNCK